MASFPQSKPTAVKIYSCLQSLDKLSCIAENHFGIGYK